MTAAIKIGSIYTAEIHDHAILIGTRLGAEWVATGFEAEAVHEIVRMNAAHEADRVDAERYRVVRELDWYNSPLAVVAKPRDSVNLLGCDFPNRERLDAAVDVMRAHRKGKP